MALPATDAFTDTNGVQLTAHSASWTLNRGDFDIYSNALCSDDGGQQELSFAHWNADTFDNDQYAEADVPAIITPGDYQIIGVAVRCAAGATVTGYCYSGCDGFSWMARVVAGVTTTIADAGDGYSVSDVIRIEAEGTTITPMLNGSEDLSLGAQTDSAIASGYAGVCSWQEVASTTTRRQSRIDNWEGGNLGGGAYTLPADAGNYATSGQAAGLLAGRLLEPDAGSYAMSGQAAGLLAGRLLEPDAGSYATSGQAARLLAARLLGADAGNYASAGQDAAVLAGRLLEPDAGSYATTGQAAGLLASRLLEAASGSYALTGLDATLVYSGSTYQLVCDAGSYALTGGAAALLVSRLIEVDTGVYVVTGQAADVLARFALEAEPGIYMQAGQDAALVLARILGLDAGAYATTGIDVNFVYAGHVPAERIFVVVHENRVTVIMAESRTLEIEGESRVMAIPEQPRGHTVKIEPRVHVVEAA